MSNLTPLARSEPCFLVKASSLLLAAANGDDLRTLEYQLLGHGEPNAGGCSQRAKHAYTGRAFSRLKYFLLLSVLLNAMDSCIDWRYVNIFGKFKPAETWRTATVLYILFRTRASRPFVHQVRPRSGHLIRFRLAFRNAARTMTADPRDSAGLKKSELRIEFAVSR